jgi:membrane protease subunit HflK
MTHSSPFKFAWQNGGPWGSGNQNNQRKQPNEPRRLGGGNNGGPTGGGQPDLEDVMNQFKDRLRGVWQQGQNDGNEQRWWLALAVFLIWLASGLYIVAPDEEGVVSRFGAYHRTTESGLHYHLPWPIETLQKPNVTRENIIELGFRTFNGQGNVDVPEESMMLTGDENIVDLDFAVRWRVANAKDFLFRVDDVEETVASVAESVMRETIGRHPIDDALADNKIAIQQETRDHLQAVLDYYRAGVQITGVDMQQVNPPVEVIDAFRDVQAARADAEKATNEAKGYANRILPLARGQAAQLLQDAEGYKSASVARAQGEASRFNAQVQAYRTAPDVTKQRLYMDTMTEVMKDSPKVIVTGKGGNLLPFLPLNQLAPAAGPTTSPSAQPQQQGGR